MWVRNGPASVDSCLENSALRFSLSSISTLLALLQLEEQLHRLLISSGVSPD